VKKRRACKQVKAQTKSVPQKNSKISSIIASQKVTSKYILVYQTA